MKMAPSIHGMSYDLKIRIRYVVEDADRHGNVRLYFRKRGQRKVRLPGPIGSEQFWVAYQQAANGYVPLEKLTPQEIKAQSGGSFLWLCDEYYRSADFRQLHPRTQYVRRKILDRICKIGGDLPAKALDAKHVRKWRDDKADKPGGANNMIKALRQIYKFAIEYGYAETNPAMTVPYLFTKEGGFHAWSIEEVLQFEEKHPIGSKARLAFALLLYTGQRRSDIVRLGQQHVKDGWLRFTQEKNRARRPVTLELPIVPALQHILDASVIGATTFLVTEQGRPFSNNGFGNRFRTWCDEAGLLHCSAHGLRKAAASRLAELGCSELEIMAVTGHQTMKEVERYTKSARQKVLAGSAMAKLRAGHS